jgi:hypothetical protein
LKEGLENKHGVTLNVGVTPSGQIMAMQTPLSEKEMSAVRNGGQLLVSNVDKLLQKRKQQLLSLTNKVNLCYLT